MTTIQIPRAHAGLFRQLVEMSIQTRRKLIDAVRAASPELGAERFALKVAASAELGLASDQATAIVDMLASMFSARVSAKLSARQFAEALREAGQAQKGLSPNPDWDTVLDDIEELLSLETSLGTASKALELLVQHQRIYRSSRVLTDIRPVFPSDALSAPSSAVVVHTLKLDMQSGTNRRTLFVALDRDDLIALKSTLERALEKDALLEEQLKLAGMTIIPTGGGR